MTILGRGLLLFWASWFSVVFASNLTDAMQQAGILPSGWHFVSGNFGMIRQSVEIYGLGVAFAALLFVGVLLVQLGAATFFWRAFLSRKVAPKSDPNVLRAFAAGIGMFAAFLLADEIFVVYERLAGIATTHLLVLCALLLSYLVIRIGEGERANTTR